MIDYKPENKHFNWIISDHIPSEHWQQLISQIPYSELVQYLQNNPQINYLIQEDVKC